MSNVVGAWECVTKTPIGDQKMVMTIVAGENGAFLGTSADIAGSIDLLDVSVDNQHLTWKMKMTSPMPMTLEGNATVDGDVLSGTIKAGFLGKSPLTGKRIG